MCTKVEGLAMKKRIYLYVLLTFLCGFAINLQAAVVSLGTEDTPLPKANFVEKTEAGDLSLMGEIVMKSTHCSTDIRSCAKPKIGKLKDGYSNCYSECKCPDDWVKVENLEDLKNQDDVCPDNGAIYTPEDNIKVDCTFGETADENGNCVKCPIGTYKDTDGHEECTVCPAGTYNTSTGNRYESSCKNCPKGAYCPGENVTGDEKPGTKILCPAGTASNVTKATSIDTCVECTDCKYTTAGASTCNLTCSYGIISADNTSCDNSSSSISCPSGYEYSTGNLTGCQSHATTAVTSANFCNASGKISTSAKYCKTCTKCYIGYKLVNGKCEGCTAQSAPSGYPNSSNPGCNASSKSQKTYADQACGTGYTTWYSSESCSWNQECISGRCQDKCGYTHTSSNCNGTLGGATCEKNGATYYQRCDESCTGYYDCGGGWQYCEGNTCPQDPKKCSVFCVSDYFGEKCSAGPSVCEANGGVYRSGYCSVSCPSTPTCTETCIGETSSSSCQYGVASTCSLKCGSGTRYKCNSAPSCTGYNSKCDGYKQVAKNPSDSCNGMYKDCTCENGWTMISGGSCVPNTPTCTETCIGETSSSSCQYGVASTCSLKCGSGTRYKCNSAPTCTLKSAPSGHTSPIDPGCGASKITQSLYNESGCSGTKTWYSGPKCPEGTDCVFGKCEIPDSRTCSNSGMHNAVSSMSPIGYGSSQSDARVRCVDSTFLVYPVDCVLCEGGSCRYVENIKCPTRYCGVCRAPM